VGLGQVLDNGNVVHVYTKNTVTATEEFLRKCVTPKAQRVLKKHFENAHIRTLFNLAKTYLENILSVLNIDTNVFWEKLREAYPSERYLMEKIVGILRAVPETENLLVELQLIDRDQISLLRKKEESVLKVLNIFSSHHKGFPVELDFLDENHIACPLCVPTLNNSPHKGMIDQTSFTVHTAHCKKIASFHEETVFSIKFRKNKPINSMIYMRIETDDVSGITHAISSVFKNVNLEIFNVENDHTKALYRLAFYQKSPQTVSSYLEHLHKIQEVRNIAISTKNVFGMQLL